MQGLRGGLAALSKGLVFPHRSWWNSSSCSSTGGFRLRDVVNSVGNAHQVRGIRVRVRNGNLEDALRTMQRKMVSSGMERLIRNVPRHHLKESEKRILAQKKRHKRERAQDLAAKLKTVLVRKVRGL